ncbi:hypothetical protein J6P68_03160 [bacterium]|nr:hypothetical protein [bacterium]
MASYLNKNLNINWNNLFVQNFSSNENKMSEITLSSSSTNPIYIEKFRYTIQQVVQSEYNSSTSTYNPIYTEFLSYVHNAIMLQNPNISQFVELDGIYVPFV